MLFEVYDIETLSNLFTYTGYCRNTNTLHQFVIHQSQNDYEELLNHLFRDPMIMIGFNNEGFDYPILHHMINHRSEYIYLSGNDLAEKIYKKSQDIINMEFSMVADKNKHIRQIDLYMIHHYNNANRRTSLKDLEFNMRMSSVQDMPIDHRQYCFAKHIPIVLSYNEHDVMATNQFLDITLGKTDNIVYKGKNKIELRQAIGKKFKLPCLNYADVKIGEQIILNEYCRITGKKVWDVKKLRTYRGEIELKECIPDWVSFKSKEFNNFLNLIKRSVITGKKGEFTPSVIYHGIKIDFGIGGAHGSIKPGVYISDENYIIIDLDVSLI